VRLFEKFETWLRKMEERQARRQLEKGTIRVPPKPPDATPVKGEATGTFENVRAMVDRATEEKRKTRTILQRVVGLMKDD
jgi:hypothetical protein